MKENNNGKEKEVVELYGDQGDLLKFYHVGTIEYKKGIYVFFQPSEPVEGVDPDELVIFTIGNENGEEVLLPVEDDDILDEVYDIFVSEQNADEEGVEAETEEEEPKGCNSGRCSRCGGCPRSDEEK
ncbi:MAG: DUF1292 domain-containing protein [Clostridia bacterium]|nr:DUF1292 domain-containing protein [Clostridia bacterium]